MTIRADSSGRDTDAPKRRSRGCGVSAPCADNSISRPFNIVQRLKPYANWRGSGRNCRTPQSSAVIVAAIVGRFRRNSVIARAEFRGSSHLRMGVSGIRIRTRVGCATHVPTHPLTRASRAAVFVGRPLRTSALQGYAVPQGKPTVPMGRHDFVRERRHVQAGTVGRAGIVPGKLNIQYSARNVQGSRTGLRSPGGPAPLNTEHLPAVLAHRRCRRAELRTLPASGWSAAAETSNAKRLTANRA